MFRVSKLTDYGMVVMAALARRPERVRAAAEIATETGIAQPTVSKILKTLTRESLVDSFRGVNGGYRIAADPKTLSVASIITALEGPIALTECSSAGSDGCEQVDACSIRGNWQAINDAVRDALENVTLAQFAQPAGVSAHYMDQKYGDRKVIPILSVR